MKFKDFTQEAYDDIQSYMGGEEQWEEINKTYGVVETKGIFQYDYESQLRNAATEYQRQNEEASNSVRRMFDNVMEWMIYMQPGFGTNIWTWKDSALQLKNWQL